MKKRVEDQSDTFLASSTQERLQSQKEFDADKIVSNDCSSANHANEGGLDDSSLDSVDMPKGRPISPGTLALMCDEQDTIFMAAASPNGLMGHGCDSSSQLPCGQGMAEAHAEQERIVLTKFRDCLNRLITFGEIKETKCSSLARTELGNEKGPSSTGLANTRTRTGSQQGPFSNGVVKVPATAKPPQMVTSIVATSSSALKKIPSLPQNGDNKLKS